MAGSRGAGTGALRGDFPFLHRDLRRDRPDASAPPLLLRAGQHSVPSPARLRLRHRGAGLDDSVINEQMRAHRSAETMMSSWAQAGTLATLQARAPLHLAPSPFVPFTMTPPGSSG